jgi:hypothetical protein
MRNQRIPIVEAEKNATRNNNDLMDVQSSKRKGKTFSELTNKKEG